MKPLDKFGQFFVVNARDKGLDFLQGMLEGKWNAPEFQSLQNTVSNLTPDLKTTVRDLVDVLLTRIMHDILFAFQESHDCGTGIEITVNGQPVGGLSDGIHGEIFGEAGWIVRFSNHPSAAEIERTRSVEAEIKRMLEDGGNANDTR